MVRFKKIDRDLVLDIALREFWLRGYEGTSITDIEIATGISRMSIYRFFISKEQLFYTAVDRHLELYLSFISSALSAPTVRGVVGQIIEGVIRTATDPNTPPGSLIVHSALACSQDHETVRAYLIKRRAELEHLLMQRLLRAQTEGELSPARDCRTLAAFVSVLCDGIALQAKSAAGPSDFAGVLQIALGVIAAECNERRPSSKN